MLFYSLVSLLLLLPFAVVVSLTEKSVSVIDVAGGTGDIAFRLAECMRSSRVRTAVPPEIVVTDINEGMLTVGQQRAAKLGFATGTD